MPLYLIIYNLLIRLIMTHNSESSLVLISISLSIYIIFNTPFRIRIKLNFCLICHTLDFIIRPSHTFKYCKFNSLHIIV